MSRARRPRTNGAWRPGVRLGIDVGKVRVGVAKSDPAGILATPLTTLRRDLEPPGDGVPQDIAEVVRLVELHESVEVVVGLPVNLAGTEGPAAEQVRRIAREAKVPILLGSDQIERGSPTRYYNSAFLIEADGSTAGVYRKMHLVPFGEFVPLQQFLFFAGPLVERVGGFSAGEDAVLLPVGGHRISTAICYEIVYPSLVRQFVQQGSELLTTITNDAWFGATSAPYQHFAQASMRAIETGRYLVRSANTGISGIVDPSGRVLAASRIFEPAVVVQEVRLLTTTTLYTRIGDSFAYLSAVLTLLLLLQSRAWRLSTT